MPVPADAQVVNGFGFQRAVGGISINSDGLIANASVDTLGKLRAERVRLMQRLPADLQASASLRKVSLRGLEEAIEESLRTNKPLAGRHRVLAGLQDIRYVFVYPEQKDIVLVGFGEGWQLDRHGNFVGVTTGKPVLLLDDLLVALRTAATTARGGISCSIDPTPEGIEAAGGPRRPAVDCRATAVRPRRASRRPWAGKRSPSPACPPRAILPPCWSRPTTA